MASEDEVAADYASSLVDLTVNSKPLINMLTMLAEENVEAAPVIVRVIERHLAQVNPGMKLPVLYLVDSIVKNIGGQYTTLFTQNIVSTFCGVFEKVEESTRAAMFKLRQTWSDVFPPKKLYALDVRVKAIDPAWPITAPPPTTSIHLNPNFLPKTKEDRPGYNPKPTRKSGHATKTTGAVASAKASAAAAAVVPSAPEVVPPASDLCETEMRENLLRKQKELLELQQKKLELELLQTKARLQQQQVQIVQHPDVVQTSFDLRRPAEEPIQAPIQAPICVPEPMDLSETPPDMTAMIQEEIPLIPPQPPTIGSLAGLNQVQTPPQPESTGSRSPGKRRDKEKEPREKEPSRKKSRKDSDREDSGRSGKKESSSSRSRKDKGKEQHPRRRSTEEAEPSADVTVVAERPSQREVAKSMPRIPKLSQRSETGAGAPPLSSSGAGQPASRDPRMLKQVQHGEDSLGVGTNNEDDVQVVADYVTRSPGRRSSRAHHHHNNNNNGKKTSSSGHSQAERRKADGVKKESSGEAKKRRNASRFDNLFGVEDIDLRKDATPAAPLGAAAVEPPMGGRESPTRVGGWPAGKRGGPPGPTHRGRGGWSGPARGGRGGRGGAGPREEEDRAGSPRNMDFILEQAKEDHRNGVINDGEYSTIIRQVFQMSETKMIREAQRRDSFPGPGGPVHHGPGPDFGRFGPGGPGGPPGPPGRFAAGEPERGWNDPRHRGERFPDRGFPPGPGGRIPRYDMPQRGPPDGRPLGGPRSPNTAFEVRPDDDMKTIPIDNVPREIRFYGDNAVILMAADDPRLLGFQPAMRRVLLDGMPLECTVNNEHYSEFLFDGQVHRIKLGAPTRELYIDDKWYECMFGGPPITINLGGRPAQIALEGPPPTVKIGQERRFDLLAGRVTMIIDAHSVVPVYLDLKLQHFQLDGQVFTLQFKDALRTVVIDGQPYAADFGGLPMAIFLDGRKHFARFSSLPRGVEPGRVLQASGPGGFVERPPAEQERRDQEPAVSSAPGQAPLNIGELLAKLVSTGLLPGTGGAPEAPQPAVKEEVKKEEVVKPIKLHDSESMKMRPTSVVSLLYSGMQCGSCGLRFPADQTVRYSTHLDWHFRQNRREKGAAKRPQSRKWYCSVSDWIQFEETEISEEKRLNWFDAQKEKSEKDGDRNGDDYSPEESTSVPKGEAPEDNKCFVCHEELETFFHEEHEEWHLRDSVRMEGITYHRLCYRDHLANVESGAYQPTDGMDEEQEESSSSEGEEKAMSSQEEGDQIPRMESETESRSPCPSSSPPPPETTPTEAVPFIKTEEEEDEDSVMKLIAAEAPDSVDDRVKMEEASETAIPEPEQEELPFPVRELKEEAPTEFSLTDMLAETWEADSRPVDESPPEETPLDQPAIIPTAEVEEEVPTPVPEDATKDRLKEAHALDEIDEAAKQLEALISAEAAEAEAEAEAAELMEDLIGPSSSPPPPALIQESESSQDSQAPLVPMVTQTPTVITSIDGNVEMASQQPAGPIPPAGGIRIKINLFNKPAAASSPAPAPTSPPAPAKPASPATGTASDLSEGNEPGAEDSVAAPPPPPDDAALTNKPRLIGRKLTVLPLMTKGTETSGLCSIM